MASGGRQPPEYVINDAIIPGELTPPARLSLTMKGDFL